MEVGTSIDRVRALIEIERHRLQFPSDGGGKTVALSDNYHVALRVKRSLFLHGKMTGRLLGSLALDVWNC